MAEGEFTLSPVKRKPFAVDADYLLRNINRPITKKIGSGHPYDMSRLAVDLTPTGRGIGQEPDPMHVRRHLAWCLPKSQSDTLEAKPAGLRLGSRTDRHGSVSYLIKLALDADTETLKAEAADARQVMSSYATLEDEPQADWPDIVLLDVYANSLRKRGETPESLLVIARSIAEPLLPEVIHLSAPTYKGTLIDLPKHHN